MATGFDISFSRLFGQKISVVCLSACLFVGLLLFPLQRGDAFCMFCWDVALVSVQIGLRFRVFRWNWLWVLAWFIGVLLLFRFVGKRFNLGLEELKFLVQLIGCFCDRIY